MSPPNGLRSRASARSLSTRSDSQQRQSSLHSKLISALPNPQKNALGQANPQTMILAYMVSGAGRDPAQWIEAPSTQDKPAHMKAAIPHFWLPEILGSSPQFDQDKEMARALHATMRACFPHDIEVCYGPGQPTAIHHTIVIQQNPSQTLYGVALRVWERVDAKKAEAIRVLRKRSETGFVPHPDEDYWVPYSLAFLSRYPLFDLLGDYLRGMWSTWNRAPDCVNNDDVERMLNLPAPRLNDLVTIEMKDYTLCYQFPASPTGFQNFSLWPLFLCLSLSSIVQVVDAALSPTGRIIFVSRYPAILTIATESIRMCLRSNEWTGLYAPLVHARHVREVVQQPGPYMLGTTPECRSLFTAPADALVVDLDRNMIQTTTPPGYLGTRQKQKLMQRLTEALGGAVPLAGVPYHLRTAYAGETLTLAGQVIYTEGDFEPINDPIWWDQKAVLDVMDHACSKAGRNSGVRRLFNGSSKRPLTTKVSVTYLNKITRERNQYSNEAADAWHDLVTLKERMDTELTKVNKRNTFLVDELENWKEQFLKFQSFAKQLTKESQELKVKIESYKGETKRLCHLISQQKEDVARLTIRLAGTEKQRDEALASLETHERTIDNLERERRRVQDEISNLQDSNLSLLRQRDEARRVVLHLHALIDQQTRQMLTIVDEDLESSVDTSETRSISESRSVSGSSVSSVNRDETKLPKTPSHKELSPKTRHTFELSSPLKKSPVMDHLLRKKAHRISVNDETDQQLRFKTDAIADIIRSISEQCAAAAEGLHLAAQGSSIVDETISEQDEDEANSEKWEMGSYSLHRDEAGSSSNSSSILVRSRRSKYNWDSDLDSSRHSIGTQPPDLIADTHSRASMSTVGGFRTPERRSFGIFTTDELNEITSEMLDSTADDQEPEQTLADSAEDISFGTATVYKLATTSPKAKTMVVPSAMPPSSTTTTVA